MAEDWRGWGLQDFVDVSVFITVREEDPARLRLALILQGIALTELEMVDENAIIESCAEGMCVLATKYAGVQGFDPKWEVALS